MKRKTQMKRAGTVMIRHNRNSEQGSAIVIAIMVMGLLMVFAALVLSRTTSETLIMSNDIAETRSFNAAEASLETMTRSFNKLYEDFVIEPTPTDLAKVRGTLPYGFSDYNFNQDVAKVSNSSVSQIIGGPYKGLSSIRDKWRLNTVATDRNGVEVAMMREFINHRIPIFQFGIFYEDDLELFRPPRFTFGGRVHSNRHMFVTAGTAGIYFSSSVTASGEIATQSWRNWFLPTTGGDSDNTFIKNASGTDVRLGRTEGSVINTSEGAADNIFASAPWNDTSLPPSRVNPAWATKKNSFEGNLINGVPLLKLPLKASTENSDLVEIVRRGKNEGDVYGTGTGSINAVTGGTKDSRLMSRERLSNKPGIRISLADSKVKLPGCATGSETAPVAVSTPCGVRLDGHLDGSGNDPETTGAVKNRAYGYQPLAMNDGYTATRLNGDRFYVPTKQMWIKVELVKINASTGTPEGTDITEDFLSLGVTEHVNTNTNFVISGYNHSTNGTDNRAIIKLQRFVIDAPTINIPTGTGTNKYLTNLTGGSNVGNIVVRYTDATAINVDANSTTSCTGCNTAQDYFAKASSYSDPATYQLDSGHFKRATLNVTLSNRVVVPFPIKLFDTREGLYYDDRTVAQTTYTSSKIPANGVMSLVDIDVANFRRFFNGEFDGQFPNSLNSTDVPSANGWVIYVSDRRGDYDFDGEYDMEDVYGQMAVGGVLGGNNNNLDPGEDLNKDGVLNVDFTNEAPLYRGAAYELMPDYAAVTDQKYYRRGVRLINGQTLPGIYDSVNPSNTRGFTVASENGIYVKGNYNATGVQAKYATTTTPYNEYLPFNTSQHIPAAVMSDSVVILSNAWNDAKSFATPFDQGQRIASETTIRFGMIAGDTLAGRAYNGGTTLTPNQGGISPRLNGGVHNFKRFLERWIDAGNNQVYLNYSGSLINLFVSRNNNGTFKCCNTVYNPPNRNWIFDSTFLDPNRIPPGTPFFQYVQVTGFQRINW